MFEYRRGDRVDSKFEFLDAQTNEPIDVVNPTYRIVMYDQDKNEIIIQAETVLDKVVGHVGEYLVSFNIPLDVTENEVYFIYANGNHPIDGSLTLLEDQFKVLPESMFSGSDHLAIVFTKS
jgi:hypothetical protein